MTIDVDKYDVIRWDIIVHNFKEQQERLKQWLDLIKY